MAHMDDKVIYSYKEYERKISPYEMIIKLIFNGIMRLENKIATIIGAG